jgi:outer membrane protein TolC
MFTKVPLVFFMIAASSAQAQEVTLADFLRTAWENSPVAKGEKFQAEAGEELVKSARGKYFPHFSLDAIDTTGFPASNSALRVGGLMGSPYRSGFAGGIEVEQTIYDFGRIQSALEQAKAANALEESRAVREKFRFLESLSKAYVACARTRSLQERIEQLLRWAEINLKETEKYAKTGQHSIIDSSLVRTEVASLKLDLERAQELEQSLLAQMRNYGEIAQCQPLSQAWQAEFPKELQVEDPGVLLAKAEIEAAKASVDAAQSAQRPVLSVMGSAGEMQKARLVKKQDYAAGVALTFPLWNGGEDAHRAEAARSRADFEEQGLEAARLEYKTRLKGLQDQWEREKKALGKVEENLEQTRRTMKLASDRYGRLEGPLVDVREAFKQLSAMELERVQLMQSLAEVGFQVGILRK